MIEYTYKRNKIYKNNIEISIEQAKKELGNWRFKKLETTKRCRMRDKIKKQSNAIDKLYEANKQYYHIEEHNNKIELWRYNTKYGYCNFVKYLESRDEKLLKYVIAEDVRNNS